MLITFIFLCSVFKVQSSDLKSDGNTRSLEYFYPISSRRECGVQAFCEAKPCRRANSLRPRMFYPLGFPQKPLLLWAGGDSRDRTGDLLLARQALSQLSYIPRPSSRVRIPSKLNNERAPCFARCCKRFRVCTPRRLTRSPPVFVPTFFVNYMPRFARHIIGVGTDSSP